MPADPLAAAKARIAEIQAELLRLVDEKVYWEAFVKEREEYLALHPNQPERIILDTMVNVNTTGMSLGAKISAGRTVRKHKAIAAWLKAGKTVSDIAIEIKQGRPRVNSWLNEGQGNRPIPEKHVAYFLKTYGIPRSAWRRIGD